MAKCDVCGNEYDKAFTVTMAGLEHTFDSFECAIHALAPRCAHCGCTVIGHGLEQDPADHAVLAGPSSVDLQGPKRQISRCF